MNTSTPEELAPAYDEDRRDHKTLIIVLAGVLALLAFAAGMLLLGARQGTASATQASAIGSKASDATTSTVSGSQPTSDAAAAGNAQTTVAGNTDTGGNTTTGNGSSNPTPKPKAPPAPSAPAAPAAPAPVITSFMTPDSIDCHNGNFQDFSASWTTKNAVKTTISIDGAGVYKTYGPNADTSLPFDCKKAHSFKLTAFNQDGKSVSKTITLQPRNVPPPPGPDDN